MDRIFLEGMEIPCRIGCVAEERQVYQSLRVDVSMGCPGLAEAAARDTVAGWIDLRIAGEMIAAVQAQEFQLIERVAEVIATVALGHPEVAQVDVTVRKRRAVFGPEWTGVQITRRRAEVR